MKTTIIWEGEGYYAPRIEGQFGETCVFYYVQRPEYAQLDGLGIPLWFASEEAFQQDFSFEADLSFFE